jgi:uncharacterized membrane protein SpoIIM required for sporulation
MTLHQFTESKKRFWEEASELVTRFEQSSLPALKESEIQRLSFLYRLICSDLAFSRSHFPRESVTVFLNDLVSRCHPYLYQRRGFQWRELKRFFAVEYPGLCRRHARFLAAVATLFIVVSLLGFALSFLVPEMETIFLSPQMIAGLKEGKLWTESIFAVLPPSVASATILTNNISVTFLAFALGITVLGTLYVLVLNGLMLGTIFGVCYKYSMTNALLAFVAPHGFIEITAILFSGTAGLLVGWGWMSPGELSRGDSLRERAADAVRLVLGMVPVLVVAGFVEGFFSPRPDFSLTAKLAVGLTLLALLCSYCFQLANRKDRKERWLNHRDQRGIRDFGILSL